VLQFGFETALGLVFDCYLRLGAIVNGQQYFTEANFRSIGKTIEDAEAELGFPRGWTGIGMVDADAWRWKTIRKMAGGCLIEEQFERWLQKTLPHPDRVATET
jgi:hypothetical protein